MAEGPWQRLKKKILPRFFCHDLPVTRFCHSRFCHGPTVAKNRGKSIRIKLKNFKIGNSQWLPPHCMAPSQTWLHGGVVKAAAPSTRPCRRGSEVISWFTVGELPAKHFILDKLIHKKSRMQLILDFITVCTCL